MPCCPSPNLVVRKFVGTEETYRYCTECFDLPDQPAFEKALMEGAILAEEVIGVDVLEFETQHGGAR